MKYNGMNVIEANVENYPPSTPRPMLVWDDNGALNEREVIGFVNGRWVAVDAGVGAGSCDWDHAAEIPKKPTLAEYLEGVYNESDYFPYVVHPNERLLTITEKQWGISVAERTLLKFSGEFNDNKYTVVVLPKCSDAVKDMLRYIADDKAYPRAKVVFLTDEEVEV